MKIAYFILSLFITLLLELFLPRKGELEISLQPQKVLFLSQYQVGSSYLSSNTENKESAPFRLGLYYGFHDKSLNLLSYDVLKQKLPLSHQILGSDFYLDLGSTPGFVIIRDTARREIGRFRSTSNAFVHKDIIYQLSNVGHSLERYSRTGKLEWRSDLLPYISSLDNNSLGNTLVSYISGKAVLLDKQGKLENQYISSGSRINSIYGVALSEDSQNIGLIAGLDEQRFIFLEKQQGTYLFRYARILPNQLRYSQWLRFSRKNPYIFYNSSEGISVYNFRYNEDQLYHSAGFLSHFAEQETSNLQFFLFKSQSESDSLLAVRGNQGALLRLQLSGNNYSLQVQGDMIYLGQDNLIASYRTEYL